MGSRGGAPVLFRLLWKLRLRIRPPMFRPFLANVLAFGVMFSLLWALAGLDLWWGDPWTEYTRKSLVRGFSIGAFIAVLNQLGRWWYDLPRWDQLD
jgi:hypothetical protein